MSAKKTLRRTKMSISSVWNKILTKNLKTWYTFFESIQIGVDLGHLILYISYIVHQPISIKNAIQKGVGQNACIQTTIHFLQGNTNLYSCTQTSIRFFLQRNAKFWKLHSNVKNQWNTKFWKLYPNGHLYFPQENMTPNSLSSI